MKAFILFGSIRNYIIVVGQNNEYYYYDQIRSAKLSDFIKSLNKGIVLKTDSDFEVVGYTKKMLPFLDEVDLYELFEYDEKIIKKGKTRLVIKSTKRDKPLFTTTQYSIYGDITDQINFDPATKKLTPKYPLTVENVGVFNVSSY